MAQHSKKVRSPSLPLPLTAELWHEISESLTLSRRQAEICELILRGQRDKQIALATGLSVSTVRTHLERIFLKLDVADRLELILHIFAYTVARLSPEQVPALRPCP